MVVVLFLVSMTALAAASLGGLVEADFLVVTSPAPLLMFVVTPL